METGSGRAIEIAPVSFAWVTQGLRGVRPLAGFHQGVGAAADGRGPRRFPARIALHHNDFRRPRGAARRARTRHRRAWCWPRAPSSANPRFAPGHFADRQPPALLMLHPPSETTPVAARMQRRGFGMRTAARPAASGPRTPGRVGGGRVRRHGDLDGQPGRRRPDQPSRYRDPGDAPCRIRVSEVLCVGRRN